jgi:hypothetical protein
MPVPLIAAAVSAIGPMLAQRGMDLLSGVFRGAVDKGTQEIANLIEDTTGIDVNDVADGKLTDEQWVKLKEFELQHQQMLLDYRQGVEARGLEEAKLAQKDRADARVMQIEHSRSQDPFVRRFIHYYALLITFLTFVFIFFAAFGGQHAQENVRIIDTVLGFLLGVSLSAIIQFFFGSSQGSSSKQEQIDRMTQKMAEELGEARKQQPGGVK